MVLATRRTPSRVMVIIATNVKQANILPVAMVSPMMVVKYMLAMFTIRFVRQFISAIRY